MKIICTFTLLMIPGVVSSISVTGYSGGKVMITCKYERKYTENAKYFCKGQKPVTPQIGWCSDLIKTEEKNKWVHSERFSLYDDTRAAVFTVTIRDLSEEDAGTYQCGVDIHISEDFYTEVNLNIITDKLSQNIIFIFLTRRISTDLICVSCNWYKLTDFCQSVSFDLQSD
ncbi:CMRF35-like molecule 8 [Sinocyclocheilus grahami]|uniref:CMRF35-like molecule 8 n=1 Tax=Sinocyclocheilus grahami TaxID=75366 RepID=UPI0007AD176B|nr:PREDICTED: CMRF35-like molecule 8 [Sinocyclocheilus grahami]